MAERGIGRQGGAKGDRVARTLKLTATGIACVAATLFNPWGWRLHPHVLWYLSDRLMIENINELQSPNFHDPRRNAFYCCC